MTEHTGAADRRSTGFARHTCVAGASLTVCFKADIYAVMKARTVDKVPRDRFSPARVSVSGRNDPTGAAAHAGKDALHRQLHWAQGRTPLNVPRGIISPLVTPCAPVGNDPVALGAHVVGSLAAAKPAQENRTPVRLGIRGKHLPT